jgi:hypothetical protein
VITSIFLIIQVFLIIFFIIMIAINLFGTNYLLLFEGMAARARSMRVFHHDATRKSSKDIFHAVAARSMRKVRTSFGRGRHYLPQAGRWMPGPDSDSDVVSSCHWQLVGIGMVPKKKGGLSFISSRQRRKEGTFRALGLAGIETTPARSVRARYARLNLSATTGMVP